MFKTKKKFGQIKVNKKFTTHYFSFILNIWFFKNLINKRFKKGKIEFDSGVYLNCGVLLAKMTNLALPRRKAFKV